MHASRRLPSRITELLPRHGLSVVALPAYFPCRRPCLQKAPGHALYVITGTLHRDRAISKLDGGALQDAMRQLPGA